jgi:dephospho-CoA kinase
MIILGLTGSVGMGKSAVAGIFRDLGIPVHDADAAVHGLLSPGGKAVKAVAALFPAAYTGDHIDRAALGRIVFADAEKLKRLEGILHPLVREDAAAFVEEIKAQGIPLCVLDIPLLFETGAEDRVDAVVVVTAPEEVQRVRVLARPGMTEERFKDVLSRQMPDADKRARADYLIDNGGTLAETRRQVEHIVSILSVR